MANIDLMANIDPDGEHNKYQFSGSIGTNFCIYSNDVEIDGPINHDHNESNDVIQGNKTFLTMQTDFIWLYQFILQN